MVVGVGSPFGADRWGWQVIEYLKQRQSQSAETNSAVQLVYCDRPGLALLYLIKDAELAIVVDAVAGGTAGTVRELNMDQLMVNERQFSSHDVGVADTLRLGDKLNMMPKQFVLYGIESGPTQLGDRLIDPVLNETGDRIMAHIHGWLNRH
ncbi:MAG: hydrogenase maturation protease [Gammaproteobacteria bacterium]